jgi:hypothetical protein
VRKVTAFVGDYIDALVRMQPTSKGGAHWIVTTGNRRAAGMPVPFDIITSDIVSYLGGRSVAAIKRALPTKRMPNRNSIGDMITTEVTLVAEFPSAR